MLEKLKKAVFLANKRLWESGLVILTWGNASAIDREKGLIIIKPSGIDYSLMKPEDMVVLDLQGRMIEGKWRPSSDSPTHVELYRAYPQIGGIVHTHSRYATCFAQAGKSIEPLGTTHADYFSGSIPCTRKLSEKEIEGEYEKATGEVIIETIEYPMEIPAVLVNEHGPFTWGKNVEEAVYHSIVLEEVSAMAYRTLSLNPKVTLQEAVRKKHYLRKHGENRYYGQEK